MEAEAEFLSELIAALVTPRDAKALPNGELFGCAREMYRSYLWVGDATGCRVMWFYERLDLAAADYSNAGWDPLRHDPPGRWFRRLQGSESTRRIPIYGAHFGRPSGYLEFERW